MFRFSETMIGCLRQSEGVNNVLVLVLQYILRAKV